MMIGTIRRLISIEKNEDELISSPIAHRRWITFFLSFYGL